MEANCDCASRRRRSPASRQGSENWTRRTACGRSSRQTVKELSAYLTGWRGYFGFCQTPSVLRALDEWPRRRLRAIVWKQVENWAGSLAELCDAAASAGSWQQRRPGVNMALGGSQAVARSTLPCQSASSIHRPMLPARPATT
ncbi:hypothetical protein LJR220_004246 [Bradyrhizobium sp. LjRoot220]|uniref:group II intron maturase-specific domain-containing protein n=1 Tax=Bradyrhizobium sp. LjRoot220 TaxID=3342284 RepID=UPI003ECFA894